MFTGAKHFTSLSSLLVSLHYFQTLSANRLCGTSTKVISCPTAAKRAPFQEPQVHRAAGEASTNPEAVSGAYTTHSHELTVTEP